ncbi:MAG: helix-turn-helix domain-containing protein [Candidatus Eremiobacterota bacterium]
MGQEELTVQEAASRLRLSVPSLYRLLRSGRLAGRKRGNAWVVPAVSVNAYAGACDLSERLTPEREQQLAEGGRCPVCGSALLQEAPAADDTSWAHEFRECSECSFSFHEHAVTSPPDLHRMVSKHVIQLDKHVQAGRKARQALTRRQKLS